jgi:hypothetical protein
MGAPRKANMALKYLDLSSIKFLGYRLSFRQKMVLENRPDERAIHPKSPLKRRRFDYYFIPVVDDLAWGL